MRIVSVKPERDFHLRIISEDGVTGLFDVKPYLELEAFHALQNPEVFQKVINGGYYVEWDCGADLSADTIEAHLKITSQK